MPVKLPRWLEEMADRVNTDDELANTYPAIGDAAFEAVESAATSSATAALMQLVIDEVERLREIIDGAWLHSNGPYSDTELLRRARAILQKAGKQSEAAEAAGRKSCESP